MDKLNTQPTASATVDVDLTDLEARLHISEHSDIRGTIDSGQQQQQRQFASTDYDRQFDTLDEPVWHTVRRDLSAVGAKLKHVFFPRNNQTLLKEWDLWGPLFLCVFLSLLLQGGTTPQNLGSGVGPQFTDVFVITFVGSCIVTLNIKLLGGQISMFQCVCVLGYCLLPIACAALATLILTTFVPTGATIVVLVKLIIAVAAFLWAIYACTAFLSAIRLPNRRALMIYPICLFYAIITCMIVSHY